MFLVKILPLYSLTQREWLKGFKRLKAWWDRVVQRAPNLFAHWRMTKQFLPTGW